MLSIVNWRIKLLKNEPAEFYHHPAATFGPPSRISGQQTVNQKVKISLHCIMQIEGKMQTHVEHGLFN